MIRDTRDPAGSERTSACRPLPDIAWSLISLAARMLCRQGSYATVRGRGGEGKTEGKKTKKRYGEALEGQTGEGEVTVVACDWGRDQQ